MTSATDFLANKELLHRQLATLAAIVHYLSSVTGLTNPGGLIVKTEQSI